MFVRDRLAELVHSIRYQDLPAEVIHEAKRLILDTLACALGGYRSERFFGLDTLGPDMEGSKMHQTLLAAYDKLFAAA